MRQTLSVPGSLGILVLIAWAVGWLLLGRHGGAYHLLVPVGILLCLVQITRRINAD